MKKNLPKLVRGYLIFGAFYMLVESLVHFSNIRLMSVAGWPKEALAFSSLMSTLYASYSLFISLLLFYLQNNIEKNKSLIKLFSFFALFHGVLLILLTFTRNYEQIFQNFPSLAFFLPYYNLYLSFESLLSLSFVLLIYLWLKKKD